MHLPCALIQHVLFRCMAEVHTDAHFMAHELIFEYWHTFSLGNRLLKLPDNRLTIQIFIDDFYLRPDCAVINLERKVYTGYNVLCAHLLCICITYVYYSVLVKIVCSIHIFALYVDIEFVFLLLLQPYIYTCFRVTL